MTTNSRRNCRLREMHVGIVTSLRAGNKVLPSYPVKEQVVSDCSPCLLLKANENRSYTQKLTTQNTMNVFQQAVKK